MPKKPAQNGVVWPGAALAGLVTFLVFLPAVRNGFVDLDDVGYIVGNRHIAALDWKTVVWSFTHFHEANWHPLTMLSLALDRQLWGGDPFGFHLTNVILHSGTVVLSCFLFAFLLRKVYAGGGPDPREPRTDLVVPGSLAGALFFGLHPLRVESVAWASERKDVLCLFFAVAAFLWYLRYADRRSARPGRGFWVFGSYWMMLAAAALAFLSKPVAVSLPLVFLIADWYPLARIGNRDGLLHALAEKVPLLAMAAGTALLTVLAQQEPISLMSYVPVSSRLLVASKAVIFYVAKTVWPSSLAPYYPHPGDVMRTGPAPYLAYASGVFALTVAAATAVRRSRKWAALWLYFLVTLAPMLGIIQVGGQWMADRYTYLPALGLSLFWGGGVAWLIGKMRRKRHPAIVALIIGVAACQLICYSVLTERLIPFWRNTETIATREIELFPHQVGAAYNARALFLYGEGKYGGALADIDEALAIAKRKGLREKYAGLWMTRARILVGLGRAEEALAAADRAIGESPGPPQAADVEFRDELMRRIGRSEGGLLNPGHSP